MLLFDDFAPALAPPAISEQVAVVAVDARQRQPRSDAMPDPSRYQPHAFRHGLKLAVSSVVSRRRPGQASKVRDAGLLRICSAWHVE